VYLLVFIQNLLVHLAEKILLMQPLTFGGDYHTVWVTVYTGEQKACAMGASATGFAHQATAQSAET
jgi:hypothetical protein